MRGFLVAAVVAMAGNAVAQQKCDQRALARLEKRLPLPATEVAQGIVRACPHLPAHIRGRLLDGQRAADHALLDARRAYADGHYAEAIEISKVTVTPVAIVESRLFDAGTPHARAHALAVAVFGEFADWRANRLPDRDRKCDQSKLARLEALSNLSPLLLSRGILEACPNLPLTLSASLSAIADPTSAVEPSPIPSPSSETARATRELFGPLIEMSRNAREAMSTPAGRSQLAKECERWLIGEGTPPARAARILRSLRVPDPKPPAPRQPDDVIPARPNEG